MIDGAKRSGTSTDPACTVWPILHYNDTEAALTFLVDILGFREMFVARDDVGIVHAELRWPDGGAILFGSALRGGDGVHSHLTPGTSAMYVPVADDMAIEIIHRRAVDMDAVVVEPPHATRFGSGAETQAMTIADTEGYLWTFGTYRGAPERATR